MEKQFWEELQKLKNASYIKKEIFEKFKKRIQNGKPNVREENPQDHFCSMLLLYDRNKKTFFLGHHIKADDWISPGGHIDKNETPSEAAKREFEEEVDSKINPDIQLFDITYFNTIKTQKYGCEIHYDFWYAINHEEFAITFDRNEFFDARWMPIEEALKRVKRKEYQVILKDFITFFL
jgi:8-oxo-dGTP pyrophosphatase MutT (NUDIX family)